MGNAWREFLNTFDSVCEILKCDHLLETRAATQYISAVSVVLYKVVLTFDSASETKM